MGTIDVRWTTAHIHMHVLLLRPHRNKAGQLVEEEYKASESGCG